MSENDYTVECGKHGTQPASFVCRHVLETLRDGQPRGFWSAHNPDGDRRPDAWCSECEVRVQEAGGDWDEDTEALAGVSLLCGACYDRAKAINK